MQKEAGMPKESREAPDGINPKKKQLRVSKDTI
jgi:hypothetical protein